MDAAEGRLATQIRTRCATTGTDSNSTLTKPLLRSRTLLHFLPWGSVYFLRSNPFGQQTNANRRNDHQRAERIDFGADAKFDHAKDPQWQSSAAHTGSELSNDEVVQRQDKRQ